MKITIGNVCFIRDPYDQKYLFLLRNRPPMQGLYTGVGGKTLFEEDIHDSCVREVKEETDLDITEVALRGVIKTILEGTHSSWILFVYSAKSIGVDLIDCPEGELQWIDKDEINSLNMIGFIREIMPYVLENGHFIEGTIIHDLQGEVVHKKILVHPAAALNKSS